MVEKCGDNLIAISTNKNRYYPCDLLHLFYRAADKSVFLPAQNRRGAH